MPNYTAYHVHSDYSLQDSATNFQDYINKAVELGQTAIAFSEHGNIKGHVYKRMACKAAGLKYIHACEVYLTKSLLQNVDGEMKKVRDNYHTILIAKNYDGYLELNNLVSMANDDEHRYYDPRLTFDEFLNISTNIISTSACLASPLNKLSLDDPYYERLVKKYDFLEIQPHMMQDQVDYNRHLATLSQKYHKPLIVGTDAHSVNDYKNECRNILMLRKKQHYDGEDEMDLVYRSYDEVCEAFRKQDAIPESMWLEALENTNVMADMVEEYEIDTSNKYPILYGSAEEDEQKLIKNVWDSFEDKLRNGVIPKSQESVYRSALQEELNVFHKIGMCGFIQSMSELIRWCHNNGIVTGPARGSVAGSRVAYVTDIIDLNPETWGTVFSRFANEDRIELGDIDTDVIESDRPRIFEYIINRFGQDLTARVPTYNTIKERKVVEVIVGAFANKWEMEHPGAPKTENPYPVSLSTKLKKEFVEDGERFAKDHPDVAYYIDGLLNIKESQGSHPAGMVISPVTLADHYGTFVKDGEIVLQIDMEEAHDVGLVKYDFLVLRNIGILKDAYSLAGLPYPKSHEVNWDDQEVWTDMVKSPVGIFQMEGDYAFHLLKDYEPHSIFDMSLVTACIRPSGASYRNDLIAHKPHKNPSAMIDKLLAENNGYLVYQEDIIKFLQVICGLSGSEADTVRRGIAAKKMEILDKMMPKIIEGYCGKSDQPREIAEAELAEYIQIIEDASSYMFGKNHSIAYCLIGYMCAWLRKYYPYQFITSLLNNAANQGDIANAKLLAGELHAKVSPPKYGVSRDTYGYDEATKEISKGAADIKGVGAKVALGLYEMAHDGKERSFVDVIIDSNESIKDMAKDRMDALIAVGYFDTFGNIAELSRIHEMVREFKYGDVKSYKCSKVGDRIKFIEKYASNLKKDGTPGSSYKFESKDAVIAFLREAEQVILSLGIPDVSFKVKAANQKEYLGYIDLVTGREEDRRKLYIMDYYEIMNKWGGKGVWKVRIKTRSIGSGKEATLSLSPALVNRNPIKEGSVIEVKEEWLALEKGQYWVLHKYNVIE